MGKSTVQQTKVMKITARNVRQKDLTTVSVTKMEIDASIPLCATETNVSFLIRTAKLAGCCGFV